MPCYHSRGSTWDQGRGFFAPMNSTQMKQELDRTAQALSVSLEENEAQRRFIERLRNQLTKALEEVVRLSK